MPDGSSTFIQLDDEKDGHGIFEGFSGYILRGLKRVEGNKVHIEVRSIGCLLGLLLIRSSKTPCVGSLAKIERANESP